MTDSGAALFRSSIAEYVRTIARGEMDWVAALKSHLSDVREHDQQFSAWVELFEADVLESASQLAARIAAGGSVGDLAGVPVGVKDIVDVRGRATLGGSKQRVGHVAECDAEVVARLRAADALILGKTVTTEHACFDPSPTRNPHDSTRTPGGSSSGSAASLAAHMCMGAIGSQTGGSIIRPASFCGVCGLKPAFGRIPMDGVLPVSFHLDHLGPMARTVEDLAILWSAMSGQPVVAQQSGGPPTVAVLESWTMAEGADVWAEAIGQLEADRPLPRVPFPVDWRAALEHHATIMAVEAAAVHRSTFETAPESFGEKIRGLIQRGLDTPAWRYADALAAQLDFRDHINRLLAPWDAVLMPSTLGPAPGIETTGDPRFNSPWSFAGVPAATLPCGLVAANGSALPIGMQLVSVRRENELLATAAWCEQRIDWARES